VGLIGIGIVGWRLLIMLCGSGEVRPPMSDNVIEVEGLTKRYGRTTAVDDISFTVGKGEIFGLLGPNGAGKTHHHPDDAGLDRRHLRPRPASWATTPSASSCRLKRGVRLSAGPVGFYDHMTAVDNLRYTARL